MKLFCGLLLILIALSSGHLYSMDDHTNYHVVHSIWTKGTIAVDIPDDVRHLNLVEGADGRRYSYYGIGGPIIFFPFYLIGRVAGLATGYVHYLSQAGMSLTNCFATALAGALIVSILGRLGRPRRDAIAAAVIYIFATTAFVWSKQQINSVLVGTLFLLAVRLMFSPKAALAGAALGLAVNVRYDAAIGAVLLPGIMFFGGRLKIRDVLGIAAAALPFVVLLAAYNDARFGSPFALRYTNLASADPWGTPVLEGLYGLLLSPNRGLLFLSPVLLLLPWVGWRVWRADRTACALFFLPAIVYAIFFARAEIWHGGIGWGPRFLACALPLLCCGFAYRLPRQGWIIAGVLIQVWGSLVSIDSYHDYLVDIGVDPLESATKFEYAPIWGIRHVARDFVFERVDDLREALPAGGHAPTVSLRYTPDYWPFYAWKAGAPLTVILPLFIFVFGAGAYLLASAIRECNLALRQKFVGRRAISLEKRE